MERERERRRKKEKGKGSRHNNNNTKNNKFINNIRNFIILSLFKGFIRYCISFYGVFHNVCVSVLEVGAC